MGAKRKLLTLWSGGRMLDIIPSLPYEYANETTLLSVRKSSLCVRLILQKQGGF